MTPSEIRLLLATLGTQRQAAEALGVGLRTVERWCAKGCDGFNALALTAILVGPAVTIRHETPVDHTAIVADDMA